MSKTLLAECNECHAVTARALANREKAPKRGTRLGICITKERCYGDVLALGVVKLETGRST